MHLENVRPRRMSNAGAALRVRVLSLVLRSYGLRAVPFASGNSEPPANELELSGGGGCVPVQWVQPPRRSVRWKCPQQRTKLESVFPFELVGVVVYLPLRVGLLRRVDYVFVHRNIARRWVRFEL